MNSLKPRILCVDDEPMNLGLLEAMLPPRCFEVVTASNEGDGRTIPQHFDPLVLAAFREIHGRFAEIFRDAVPEPTGRSR